MAEPLTLDQVRKKFPQYDDLPDDQLVRGMHKKFYSDMPFDAFAGKLGYKPPATAANANVAPPAAPALSYPATTPAPEPEAEEAPTRQRFNRWADVPDFTDQQIAAVQAERAERDKPTLTDDYGRPLDGAPLPEAAPPVATPAPVAAPVAAAPPAVSEFGDATTAPVVPPAPPVPGGPSAPWQTSPTETLPVPPKGAAALPGALGRVAGAAQEGYESTPMLLAPAAEKWLKDRGATPYMIGVINSPAYGMALLNAAFKGGQEAVQAVLAPILGDQGARDLAAMPEAFMGGPHLGGPTALHDVAAGRIRPPTPGDMGAYRERGLGITARTPEELAGYDFQQDFNRATADRERYWPGSGATAQDQLRIGEMDRSRPITPEQHAQADAERVAAEAQGIVDTAPPGAPVSGAGIVQALPAPEPPRVPRTPTPRLPEASGPPIAMGGPEGEIIAPAAPETPKVPQAPPTIEGAPATPPTLTAQQQLDAADAAHRAFFPTMQAANAAHMAGTMPEADYLAIWHHNKKLLDDYDAAYKRMQDEPPPEVPEEATDTSQGDLFGKPVGETPAAPPPPTPTRDAIAELDARGAADAEYRDLLSTGSKGRLRAGETWRGRAVRLAGTTEPAPPTDNTGTQPTPGVDQPPQGAAAPPVNAEPTNGLQGSISPGDARPGAEDVHGPAAVGEDGRAPGSDVGVGPQDAGGPPGGGAEVGLGGSEEPLGAPHGGGDSPGDANGLPHPGAGTAPGATGRPPRPDDWVAGQNAVLQPGEVAEGRGPTLKARDNVAAIELAKRLMAEDRPATRAEQTILAKYVGWGGLSGAFPHPQTGLFGKGLEKVGARLREILTPEEHTAAVASTPFAHYTAEHVIRSMWDAVARMGFKGGLVFEPGMGVGHFVGMMPADIAAKTSYQGIEYDHMTAAIAKLIYPESGVRHADFTTTPMPENHFDLVIGNPPFGARVIHADPKYTARNFSLHDYFFAKSMDSLRPGGLMAFVTSAGTMNKLGSEAREYLAERAEFAGGIRLNSSAFRQNAGTDVTTDILFFKKRAAPVALSDVTGHEAWTSVIPRELPNRLGGTTVGNVSRYFSEHPEMVLGQEGFFDKLIPDRYAVQPIAGRDLAADLREAIGRLPENIMDEAQTPGDRAVLDFESGQKKDGSFYIDPKRGLMQYRGGAGQPVARRGKEGGGYTQAEIDRIHKLVPMRDALRDVFRADLAEDAEAAAAARVALNAHYDAFVRQFGPINKAEFSYRRPLLPQIMRARLEAREEARNLDLPFDDGDFDPSILIANGANITAISKAYQAKRDAMEQHGGKFDQGSFDPDDMPDVVIEKRPNIAPFMADPESYRLRSIEEYNDKTHEASKKRVFRESVLTRETEPQITSANDGLLWSLNKFGRMDLDQIAAKIGQPREAIIHELGNTVYRVPGTNDTYQSNSEYLSGDVVAKLDAAREAMRSDPEMERNVKALEAALPPALPPDEITMTLGMPWLPPAYTEQFAAQHLKIGNVKVVHIPKLGEWKVAESSRGDQSGLLAWGTARRGAVEILEDALNRIPPKIYDTDRDGKRTFNAPASQEAQDKYVAIKEAFREWIDADPEREGALAKLYNDSLNRTVLRVHNGDYLTTPGISAEWRWRPHQTRVVSRIIQTGTTYMAHAVGAGKTSAMIGAGMEMRRLGLVRKPMYVVPNHMLGQFAKEFYEQYPTARISVADDERFHTDRRKQFVSDVAQDDLDAVIITHSAFGMIPIDPEYQRALIQEEMDNLADALSQLDPRTDRITVKGLQDAIAKLEQKLSGGGSKKDITNTFQELGVDFLFVDEAHNFRKLSFATRQALKGIDRKGSNMAWDLYTKIRYLDEQNPGRAAVLASGTPVTNTMGELYTLSRYLQRQAMEARGVGHFDSWSQMFGDTKTSLEAQPDGSLKPVTRFAQFVNMPELYKMVGEVMDVVTPSQLAQYVTRPTLAGGERELHIAPFTPELARYQAELGARMTAIAERKGPPEKGDDILLSVINDGRHAAIDPRFVMPGKSDPRSKLNMLVDNVYKIWADTHDQQFYHARDNYKDKAHTGPATQMIFMNMGVNGRGPQNFSSYAWIRGELRRRGIPANQIAVIGDYKSTVARQTLFNDMNEGKVRVLLGSVQKMGTGVNAQRLLIALHNGDPLWFPADDEQRVGRMLRQGNMNPEVQVHDYTTMDTYDRTMWDMMGRKGRFIEQFFRGDPELRYMEDLGEASTYEQAAAMATSDRRIFKLTEMKQALQTAHRRESAFNRRQYDLKTELERNKYWVDYYAKSLAGYQADLARRVSTRGDDFRMTIGGAEYATRKDAAAALAGLWDETTNLTPREARVVASIGGFDLVAARGKGEKSALEYFLRLNNGQELSVNGSMHNPDFAAGMISSAETKLRTLDDLLASRAGQLAEARVEGPRIEAELAKPFTGRAEIERLRAEVRELEAAIAAPPEAPAAPAQSWNAPVRAELGFDTGHPSDDLQLSRRGPSNGSPLTGRNVAVRRGAQAMIDRLRHQVNLDRATDRDQGGQSRANIDPDAIRAVEDFIQFIGERMFTNVGLRIMRDGQGAAGAFEMGRRIVYLFREAINAGQVDHTMIHELWHSLERSLPTADRTALIAEYRRQQGKWLRANPWARALLRGGDLRDSLGGQEAVAWLARHGNDPAVLRQVSADGNTVRMIWTRENYRFRDASEYFAETMSDRHFDDQDIQAAKARSIFAHLRDIWRRFLAGIQRLFGRDATGRVYEGFRQGDYDPATRNGPLSAGDMHMARGPRPRPPTAGFDVVRDKKGLDKLQAEWRAALAPTSLKGAAPMERALRHHGAVSQQAYAQVAETLDKVRWDVDRLSRVDQIRFTHAMETGQSQATPELQVIADTLRGALDDWRDRLQTLGVLENAIDDYMGHIWGNHAEWKAGLPAPTEAQMRERAEAAKQAKVPLQGSGNFLKKRTFANQLEGISQGLIPVTYNPIDLQLIKLREMQKWYYGTKLATLMKDTGIARFYPENRERDAHDAGLTALEDKVFRPTLRGQGNPAGFGALQVGRWYAPDAQARLFNNYMSQGLSGQSITYDTVRATGNILNSLQLGFSGFHATFVAMDTMISRSALGLQQVVGGQIAKGLANIGLSVTPYALVKALREGGKLRSAWLDPGHATPEYLHLAELLNAGGGRINMDQFYANSAAGAFFRHLRDFKHPTSPLYQIAQMYRDQPTILRKVLMPPLQLFRRVMDQIMEPLMGAMVPRAKLGVFAAMARMWEEQNPPPGAGSNQMADWERNRDAAMIKAWDSVENRLGQMTYDNIYWDKKLKDTAFISMRSVGWNLGTWRELGGGVVDTGAGVYNLARHGVRPEFTHRMAYSMMLPVITAIFGAMITYLFTGQAPQDLLDYYYPTIGANEDGTPRKVSMPGYMKDVVAVKHDPLGTIGNKLHPLPATIVDMLKNRDYYGGIIHGEDDSRVGAYMDYLLNQAVPFSLRAKWKMQEDNASPVEQALAFWGFNPPPQSIVDPDRAEAFQHKQDVRATTRRDKDTTRLHFFTTSPDVQSPP